MDTQMPDYETFDAIIIATGQAAAPLASALGQAGWKTTGKNSDCRELIRLTEKRTGASPP